MVEALAITFLEDWELETGEGLTQQAESGDAHPQTTGWLGRDPGGPLGIPAA